MPLSERFSSIASKNISQQRVLLRVANNSMWLMGEQFLRLAISFVVGTWVARYLGPNQFGLFNFAIAVVALIGTIATLGIPNIVVRDIVRDPHDRYRVLGSAVGLQLAAGFFSYALCLIVILLLRPNDMLARLLVLILAFGPIFRAVDPINYWFQSQLKSKYTVLSNLPSLVIISLLRVALVYVQAPLAAFAAIVVMDALITALTLVSFYQYSGESVLKWRFTVHRARRLMSDGWPLLIASIATLIYMKIDQVMLNQMLGNAETGIYSAAVRISEMWYFVPTALVSSFFPILTSARNQGQQEYKRKLMLWFRLMAGLSLSVAVVTSIVANIVINFVYGQAYSAAGPVLAVHIWASIPVAMGVALSPWLVNEGFTRVIMERTILGAIVNVALNLWLIPRYGAMGAAIATLAAYVVATFVWQVVDPRIRQVGLMQLRAMLLFV